MARLTEAGDHRAAERAAERVHASAPGPRSRALALYAVATAIDEQGAPRRDDAIEAYRRFLAAPASAPEMRRAAVERTRRLSEPGPPPMPTSLRLQVVDNRIQIAGPVTINNRAGDVTINVGDDASPSAGVVSGVAMLVVGALSVAAGAVMGLLATDRYNQLAPVCSADRACPARYAGEISDHTTFVHATGMLSAVGGALMVGGVLVVAFE